MPAPSTSEIAQTFVLEYPQSIKGVLYTELNARRPKVKDLRVLTTGADKDPIGAYNRFICGLCTVPIEVIDELELRDYNKIREWVRVFLPKKDDEN